jgi:hypothetical protein
VYKAGPDVLFQANLMRRFKHIYAPVLAQSEIPKGYVMPRLEPLQTAAQVAAALGKLQDLWNSKNDWSSPSLFRARQRRAQYQRYLVDLPCCMELQHKAYELFLQVKDIDDTQATSVHGDATIENAMWFNNQPVWIDPCTRMAGQSFDIALDCGKLFQSMYGYHELPKGARTVISGFIGALDVNPLLVKYYFATHLVRLWRHQPEKQNWALRAAEEAAL